LQIKIRAGLPYFAESYAGPAPPRGQQKDIREIPNALAPLIVRASGSLLAFIAEAVRILDRIYTEEPKLGGRRW